MVAASSKNPKAVTSHRTPIILHFTRIRVMTTKNMVFAPRTISVMLPAETKRCRLAIGGNVRDLKEDS